MSFILSNFFGWAANTLVLSVILLGFYFLLSWVQIKSSSKYLFLKISFVTLPIIPFFSAVVYRKGFQFFKTIERSVPSLGPIPTLFMDRLSNVQSKTDSQNIIGWIALALFCVYLIFVLRGLLLLMHSAWTLRLLKNSSQLLETRSGQKIYVHSHSIPPIAAGIFKPIILISKTLLERISEVELAFIIKHENIHIARHDPLFNAIRLILRELMIFSPFIQQLSTVFEEEMELSVDEQLLEQEHADTKAYGTLLLRLGAEEGRSLSVLCNGFFKSKSFIKKRIENMKTIKLQKSKLRMVTGLLVTFFITGALGLPALGLDEKSKVKAPILDGFSDEVENYCFEKVCSQSFKETLTEAFKGNPEAENKVGEMLHFAEGVKQNDKHALEWYLKASQHKHAVAANHIGRIYLNGEGVARDPKEACKWYVLSGERGYAWGMMNAASCYDGQSGFEKDDVKMAEWYEKAEKTQPGIYQQYIRLVSEQQKK